MFVILDTHGQKDFMLQFKGKPFSLCIHIMVNILTTFMIHFSLQEKRNDLLTSLHCHKSFISKKFRFHPVRTYMK